MSITLGSGVSACRARSTRLSGKEQYPPVG
jgi:hypothetical protein